MHKSTLQVLQVTVKGAMFQSLDNGETQMDSRKVIPHPTKPGYWTICITDDRGSAIYGAYDRRELAIAYLLTR